jgi:dipeptidyl-peptidase III
MIQSYKTLADVESARAFYAQYSAVDEQFIVMRDIVLANRKPRRIVGSHNLSLGDDTVVFTTYETNPQGLIRSFIDRFEISQAFVEEYIQEWRLTSADIRV